MDYSNLKNKTIYDFCNDESIINDLVVSKEDFFRDLEEYPLLNAHVLIETTNERERGIKPQSLLFWRFAVGFLSVYYAPIDDALVIPIRLVFGNSERPQP